MRLLSAPFEDKAGVKMMQTGLWGLQVKHVRDIDHGESRTTEVYDDDIQSVLPLMGYLKERGSLGTVGGRCASMASLRSCMINSFFRPGSELARIDASTVVADANTYRASEFSQHTLARLLAMQLIGAGYSITSEVHFDHQNPQSQPLIGTPNGFQGNKLGACCCTASTRARRRCKKSLTSCKPFEGLPGACCGSMKRARAAKEVWALQINWRTARAWFCLQLTHSAFRTIQMS